MGTCLHFFPIRLVVACGVCGTFALGLASMAAAQDIPIGATFICNGEHIYIENCNIRDTSDSSTCMVAHPDHLTPTGMNSYTYETRGALKKRLPTCEQPSAKQLAAAKAFQQKVQATADANQKKAEDEVSAGQAAAPSMTQFAAAMRPKDPAERQMNRCISAGRLPASCTGNALLGGFTQMISSVLPSATQESTAQAAAAGPVMAGVFQGAGDWRLDFVDGGVLVNCSFLSPNEETYSLKFESGRSALIVHTKPKPLVLAVHADGTITGPGPVTIEGVVASGYHEGGPVGQAMYKDAAGNYYDANKNKLNTTSGYSTFSSRTTTCPALNLSTKGASVGIQTMQTDLLKTMFGGDKGPPTPPGIRMQGIYAASTGFSVQFFPESAVLGCGPDAARAYPYTVVAEASGGTIRIDAPDHPLTLAIRGDNTLDPGSAGSYQVHGRLILGQRDNGDYAFAPYEQTCGLAVLTPSKEIPSTGGSTAPMAASAMMASTNGGPGAANGAGSLSSPNAPLGNAVLVISSGFAAQAGTANPLAGRPYILLRSSYGDALARGGVSVPGGMSPYKYAGTACSTNSPDCAKISQAIHANAASAVRADANGNGIFPGVQPGTYYLMISAVYNKQSYVWGQAVQLRAGQNAISLSLSNATPLN